MTTIERIQEWYSNQCDGDWEHTWGIKIDTLDNPGWIVKIDLIETELQDTPFPTIRKGMPDDQPSDTDWLCCSVKDNVFDGAGDQGKLEAILQAFLDWKDSANN
jgi:hypothetical protein